MQKTLTASALAALAAAVFAALPGSAAAADGTISFSGKVFSNTCEINVNDGTATNTVALPPQPTSKLTTAGSTTGLKYFTIKLSKCSDDVKNVRAFFESGANVDKSTFNLNNATGEGNATFVQVQLTDGSGNALKIGDPSQRSAAATSVTGGAATMTYGAQYFATGVATVGTVSTSVNYSIEYL
jgi:major type 1 subunit fimbrin (pilin)